jgi:hypothetical protein
MFDPIVLKLSHDAQQCWIKFHDSVEGELKEGKALYPIQAFGARMAEHAGRLAAVLGMFSDSDTMETDKSALECGIELARHYATEMQRLVEAAATRPSLKLAERLLQWWWNRLDARCHLREIYQFGPAAIRDARTARRVVAILEEHGHVTRLPEGTVLDGKSHREAWKLYSH